MELQLAKDSFIDEFKKIRKVETIKPKDRTKGFMYLHNSTTKRLANGGSLEFKDIDFTKFTNEDLEDYMEYYNIMLEPKINMIRKLFDIMNKAETVFSPEKRYY